jgi:hypothetical protein
VSNALSEGAQERLNLLFLSWRQVVVVLVDGGCFFGMAVDSGFGAGELPSCISPERSGGPLAGCGKSRFGSKLGVFLVTQNHHPRPFLRSWGNCARFVFRAFLPKRLFPQPVRDE